MSSHLILQTTKSQNSRKFKIKKPQYVQVFTFNVVFNSGQWESIEWAGDWDRIRAHIFKYDEIIDI